jgi:hypothetical protein
MMRSSSNVGVGSFACAKDDINDPLVVTITVIMTQFQSQAGICSLLQIQDEVI